MVACSLICYCFPHIPMHYIAIMAKIVPSFDPYRIGIYFYPARVAWVGLEAVSIWSWPKRWQQKSPTFIHRRRGWGRGWGAGGVAMPGVRASAASIAAAPDSSSADGFIDKYPPCLLIANPFSVWSSSTSSFVVVPLPLRWIPLSSCSRSPAAAFLVKVGVVFDLAFGANIRTLVAVDCCRAAPSILVDSQLLLTSRNTWNDTRIGELALHATGNIIPREREPIQNMNTRAEESGNNQSPPPPLRYPLSRVLENWNALDSTAKLISPEVTEKSACWWQTEELEINHWLP